MRNKTMAVAGGAVLLLVAVSATVFFITNADDKKPPVKKAPPTTQQKITERLSQAKSTTTAAVATNSVTVSDVAFNPPSITVKKGTPVNWLNMGTAELTIVADDNSFSGNVPKGKVYSYAFSKTGTIKYHSKNKPELTGSVTVTE